MKSSPQPDNGIHKGNAAMQADASTDEQSNSGFPKLMLIPELFLHSPNINAVLMKDTITTECSPLQGLCCSDGSWPQMRRLSTVCLTVLRTTGHKVEEQTGGHLL